LAGVAIWASYYRANIHRFVMDYFHVELRLFQMILLVMMERCSTFVFIACRGIGKTFLSALFLCAHCILYPGTKVCIASGTRGQAYVVIEKILTELKPNSPELANEIDEKNTRLNGNNCLLAFKNGSTIKIVTASDGARGNRAHILMIDEFRMVKKDTIDTILRKFLASPRYPRFLDLPEYKDRKKEFQERNKTIYASSAYYQDHWSFTRCKDSCRFMLDPERSSFVCGLPYQLAVEEGLLMEEDVLEQVSASDFNPIKHNMEMCALFWGDEEGSFFSYDAIVKNRHIEYAMLPSELSSRLPKATKLKIPPKLPGEKRLLSADIALMASRKTKNDASAIFINQMMPTKAGRYTNNIVYTEANEGWRTEQEALRIRVLFEEFDCDYIVLDTRNVGLSVFDALANDMPDPETGDVYPALSCCNNEDLALRCTNRDARRVIWAITGNQKFNSECALLLREGFRSGRIRLLVTEDDLDSVFGDVKEYGTLSIQDKLAIQMPYINTTLLINELINLQHEESSGLVKISEKSGMRKDRYSSLSYNYWVATQVEMTTKRRESVAAHSVSDAFIFRAPTARRESW